MGLISSDRPHMSDTQEKLNQLETRLEHLERYETAFRREIDDIRREIFKLRLGGAPASTEEKKAPKPEPAAKPSREEETTSRAQETAHDTPPAVKPERIKRGPYLNLEQFVGTWMISVIGVLVTIIGVAIGAKYAIDNNLISPLMRIAFGYAVGLAMIGVAVWLRTAYEKFSAILISGGLAIVYVITYFAYAYYALIPQIPAFIMMAWLTVMTVATALVYDRRVIAHIGLVGAYAVPFLLSEGSGRADILFSYTAIVNLGILAVSVKKYWRYLFFSAFIFTWAIFGAWYANDAGADQTALALTFSTLFFLIFYGAFLVYKLIHRKPLGLLNVALVVSNSFVYFGFGYAIVDSSDWANLLGLFAVSNAVLHFSAAAIIQKFRLGDRKAFYLTTALVAAFLAIAVPIQLDGSWVTVLWVGQAAFLFVVGRIKKIALFEYLSLPLFSVAGLNLLIDWQSLHYARLVGWAEVLTPFINKHFAASFFTALCLGLVCYVNRLKNYRAGLGKFAVLFFGYIVPAAFLIVLFNTFRVEIDTYFYSREIKTAVQVSLPPPGIGFTEVADSSLTALSAVWQLIYSFMFVAVLNFLNIRRFKNTAFGIIGVGLGIALIFILFTFGFYFLGELREIFVTQLDSQYFARGSYLIAIRYLVLASAAVLIASLYLQIKRDYITRFLPAQGLNILFDLGLAFTIWVVLSNELITWLEVFVMEDTNKLGLSILWGLYAVVLIVLGIMKRRKHLRIFAIALLSVTLIKLFLYDLANLETIPKTILLVSIGFMLLAASFLYYKYTKLIFGDQEPAP